MVKYPGTATPEQVTAHIAACERLESTGIAYHKYLLELKELRHSLNVAREVYYQAHEAAHATYRAIWPTD